MNRRVLKAKTEEAPQPWRVISPVDFDLFMEMLLAKLPGAIRIESSGSLGLRQGT
jgi:hypothetical protein